VVSCKRGDTTFPSQVFTCRDGLGSLLVLGCLPQQTRPHVSKAAFPRGVASRGSYVRHGRTARLAERLVTAKPQRFGRREEYLGTIERSRRRRDRRAQTNAEQEGDVHTGVASPLHNGDGLRG